MYNRKGTRWREFFGTDKGSPKFNKLVRREVPGYWSLEEMLVEMFHWEEGEAREFVGFLRPMLAYDPWRRPTAEECLEREWLTQK